MAGLSQDELECLAKSSYAYWLVSKLSPNKLPDGAQKHAVMKEIRRHYIGEGRDETKAIHVIKEAIDLRKQWNVDLMRLCFYPDLKKRWGVTEDETAIVTRLEELIGGEQSRQQMIVRGSAEGHPIAFKAHRLTPTTADENESYVIAQMYIAERAFAVAEFNTEAKVEKVLAIFYFKDYISGHSVTVSASKQSSTAMQRIYPERLKTLFICDPPFFLRIIITIVLAILSSATREKINLVIGTVRILFEISPVASIAILIPCFSARRMP